MVKTDLPKYIFAPKGKAGRPYYYYRRQGQRIPLCDGQGRRIGPDHEEFIQAYNLIHASFEQSAGDFGRALVPGSMAHLIELYKRSAKFKQLAASTQSDYRGYLDKLKERFGGLPIRSISREFVVLLQEEHAETPRSANYLIAVLRRILHFAIDRPSIFGLSHNPAAKLEALKQGEGHLAWSENDIEAFRHRWGQGSWERAVFETILYTGQRGGDVRDMVRAQYHQGRISVRQSKTRAFVEIRAAEALCQALDSWLSSHDHEALFPSGSGRAYDASAFRHRLKEAYDEAGIAVTTHGGRYAAAGRLRDLGLDWDQVSAITGHKSAQMAAKYMRRRLISDQAIDELDALDREQRESLGQD